MSEKNYVETMKEPLYTQTWYNLMTAIGDEAHYLSWRIVFITYYALLRPGKQAVCFISPGETKERTISDGDSLVISTVTLENTVLKKGEDQKWLCWVRPGENDFLWTVNLKNEQGNKTINVGDSITFRPTSISSQFLAYSPDDKHKDLYLAESQKEEIVWAANKVEGKEE